MRFAAFFREEKPFQRDKTNLKIELSLGGATIGAPMRDCARKFSKSEKMGAKFQRTTSTI